MGFSQPNSGERRAHSKAMNEERTCACSEVIGNLDKINDLLRTRGDPEIWPSGVVEVVNVAVFGSVTYPEQTADDVIESGLVDKLHGEHAVGTLVADRGGPVDVCLDVAVLGEASEHDNDAGALLPDHPPEIGEGRKERGLGCDVLLLEYVVCVDVVAALAAGVLETHAGVLARENVGVAVLRCGPVGRCRWEIQDTFAEAHGLVR